MQNYLDATREQFMAFLQLPVDKPLHMLNLLKFKDQVEEAGISGKEQYEIYIKAATPHIEKAGAKVIYYGIPQFTLIGPEEETLWDELLIVEYANKEVFVNMVTAKDYPADLRKMALADSRLVFCVAK